MGTVRGHRGGQDGVAVYGLLCTKPEDSVDLQQTQAIIMIVSVLSARWLIVDLAREGGVLAVTPQLRQRHLSRLLEYIPSSLTPT